jgi:hypothetical protein
MQKLPCVLLFVVLALVLLNIATLRQLDRLERRVATLEKKPAAALPAPSSASPVPAR